ncbi:MAG: hypothetical protein U5O39_03570 [Gammaproteobacteria bacterium]|nr:hypothetical protein [Gammaproteobacteria bacterium]
MPDEVTLTAAESKAMRQAFARGLDDIEAHFGSLDAVYGDAFRVGRDDESWPSGWRWQQACRLRDAADAGLW